MHLSSHLAAWAATLGAASAFATGPFQGFNYGSGGRQQADFEAAFRAAQALTGAPAGGFHSARLYTMIQDGTDSNPISAIPAAISTKTSLLLGLWCSAGDAVFAKEIVALKAAIAQYGNSLADLVAGISVGSEDLYRITPTGIANNENPGVGPDVLTGYIRQVRDAIANTPLAGAPIGHVDTWTAWVNGSNRAVVDASDFIGLDAYPYFQTTQTNTIENSKALFFDAVGQTQNAVGGKPIWVTETGQPVSGKVSGQSTASTENAQKYWRDVGCPLFGATNTWWYTLDDAGANPSFGIVPSLGGAPLFDLSCKNLPTTPSSTGTGSGSSSSGSSTGLPSGSGSGSGSGSSGSSSGSGAAPSATGSLTAAPNAGSPGLSTGLPSPQSSHGAGSNTTSVSVPSTSSGSGSGSGAGSGTSTGSGAGATPTTTNQNAAVIQHGSVLAVCAAVAVAMLAL